MPCSSLEEFQSKASAIADMIITSLRMDPFQHIRIAEVLQKSSILLHPLSSVVGAEALRQYPHAKLCLLEWAVAPEHAALGELLSS